MCLYADDTAIFAKSKEVGQVAQVLTEEMKKVAIWLTKNKLLTLKVKETKVMLFGRSIKI